MDATNAGVVAVQTCFAYNAVNGDLVDYEEVDTVMATTKEDVEPYACRYVERIAIRLPEFTERGMVGSMVLPVL